MSRIGRLPVTVPSNVKVDIQGSNVRVQGPQGEMSRAFSPDMEITLENNQVLVKRPSDASHASRFTWNYPGSHQQHGCWRKHWF